MTLHFFANFLVALLVPGCHYWPKTNKNNEKMAKNGGPYTLTHGLRTPREEIAFTARPKIHSHSQIFRYGGSIFCLPHRPIFRYLWFMPSLGSVVRWSRDILDLWYSYLQNTFYRLSCNPSNQFNQVTKHVIKVIAIATDYGHPMKA